VVAPWDFWLPSTAPLPHFQPKKLGCYTQRGALLRHRGAQLPRAAAQGGAKVLPRAEGPQG